MFATRADLLARCSALRLAQLAVPTDHAFPGDEQLLREAIVGADISDHPASEQEAVTLALEAIDKALADADALLISYGIPPEVQTAILARFSSTVAYYYLQGAERMTKDAQDAYDAVLKLLDRYAKGQLPGLVPDEDGMPGGMATVVSGPPRYARRYCEGEE
ncbi:MAG: DUF1320 domain-containing protein [Azoarcus sp.]|jgi:phage gp36-like protein|nr:DUF1320 domain-containing protein [Azoarcus sp.]